MSSESAEEKVRCKMDHHWLHHPYDACDSINREVRHMRATVTIPDELLAELLTIVGTNNRTRAINEAIRGYVRQANIQRLIALRGTVDIADNDEIESWDEAEYRGG